MFGNMRDWRSGDRNSAAHLNEPIAVIRQLTKVVGAGVAQIGLPEDRWRYQRRIGLITDTGPLGSEADWTDERYWVQPQSVTASGGQNDQVELADLTGIPEPTWDSEEEQNLSTIITVTNIQEIDSGSHRLKVGEPVEFWEITDLGDPPSFHYLMNELPGSIDILQDGTLVVAQTPLLNMGSTRATADIMEYVAETVGGTAGASLVLKEPTSEYMGIYFVGGNWVFDWVRSHS